MQGTLSTVVCAQQNFVLKYNRAVRISQFSFSKEKLVINLNTSINILMFWKNWTLNKMFANQGT